MDFAALLLRGGEGGFHRVERALVDQRPDEHAALRGIADRELLVDRQDSIAQFVGDRFVHDQPPQRRAALAAGAGRGEHDRAHGQFANRPTARRSCRCCRRVPAASGPAGRRPFGRRRGPSARCRSPRPAATAATRPALGRRRAPPITTLEMPGQCVANIRRAALSARCCWQAIALSGVFSDGFHTIGSPHTRPIIAFQAHTATGKLNAEITPTGPSGCHYSVSRWPGRSLAIVLP